MIITLDITKKVTETLDSFSLGPLKSYIDVPLSSDICENFSFKLHHFILNLDDEIIAEFNKQKNDKFHHLKEETFVIVKHAYVNFGKIKGMDVAMRGINSLPFETCYQTWNYELGKNDEIYETGGFSMNLPYGSMTLMIISNNPVTVTFKLDECELFNDVSTFSSRSKQLNSVIDKPLPNQGQLFVVKE